MAHNTFPKPAPVKKKRPGRLSPTSKKRVEELKERPAIRSRVFVRDGGCLLAPGLPLNQAERDWGACFGTPFTFHHVVKASDGGKYTEDNGKTLCAFHNDTVEDWPKEAEKIGLVIRPPDPITPWSHP
jgi:hypothetical protein